MSVIDFKNAPLIMGVVNVTPDSFSDGGQFYDPAAAVQHGLKLIKQGADILDIGGESTRPNAETVSLMEEQKRVLPVIEALRKAGVTAPISLDTRNADTMQKGIKAGANIINDVSALTHDIESLNSVSQAQVPVILMHMKGTPQTMQLAPHYDDVVEDVFDFLKMRINVCVEAGIKKENIIADVGIGFGKTLEDNLKLLKNLNRFHDLGVPLLLGVSRKSFIEKICGDAPVEDRLGGSLAAALFGLQNGVQIHRVHDVHETRQAFDVWKVLKP